MKVYISKTIVMVRGEVGERVVSHVDSCRFCDKRMKALISIFVGCSKIRYEIYLFVLQQNCCFVSGYKRCSGVKGSLKRVKGDFRCRLFVQGRVVAHGAKCRSDEILCV